MPSDPLKLSHVYSTLYSVEPVPTIKDFISDESKFFATCCAHLKERATMRTNPVRSVVIPLKYIYKDHSAAKVRTLAKLVTYSEFFVGIKMSEKQKQIMLEKLRGYYASRNENPDFVIFIIPEQYFSITHLPDFEQDQKTKFEKEFQGESVVTFVLQEQPPFLSKKNLFVFFAASLLLVILWMQGNSNKNENEKFLGFVRFAFTLFAFFLPIFVYLKKQATKNNTRVDRDLIATNPPKELTAEATVSRVLKSVLNLKPALQP